jgi:hypothetical protein
MRYALAVVPVLVALVVFWLIVLPIINRVVVLAVSAGSLVAV